MWLAVPKSPCSTGYDHKLWARDTFTLIMATSTPHPSNGARSQSIYVSIGSKTVLSHWVEKHSCPTGMKDTLFYWDNSNRTLKFCYDKLCALLLFIGEIGWKTVLSHWDDLNSCTTAQWSDRVTKPLLFLKLFWTFWMLLDVERSFICVGAILEQDLHSQTGQ